MFRTVCCIGIVVSAVASPAADPPVDLKSFQGKWVMSSATLGGRDHKEDFEGLTLMVTDDKYVVTAAAFAGDPRWVSEVYRTPDLQAVLFFAFFILTDPPTSPVRYPDQMVFAVIVAVVSFAIFEWTGAAFYLLAGVLAGNAWESWRRTTLHRRRVRGDRNLILGA